jgi:hypothetical protein
MDTDYYKEYDEPRIGRKEMALHFGDGEKLRDNL